jgi:hypothetical protein
MIAPKRYPVRSPKNREPKSMTVCIAAACDSGRKCVTATDGLLNYGGITADVLVGKRIWKGDWQFMYAGDPSNISLALSELDEMLLSDPDSLSRRHIQSSVLTAFRRMLSNASSFPTFGPL